MITKKSIILSLLYVGLTCCIFINVISADKKKMKPNPKLVALADNTAIDLGSFKWEIPKGEPQSGKVTDYSGMTYDIHNNRILLFGGGHSATWTDSIYAFEFKTLNPHFKSLYTPTPHKFYTKDNSDRAFWKAGETGNYPRPIGRHTYDLLIVPVDRKELLMLRHGTGPSRAGKSSGLGYTGGAVGIFDFKKEKWSMVDKKNMGDFGGYGGSAEYDPISKRVIGMSQKHIWAFDPKTKTTVKIISWYSDKKEYKGASSYSGSVVYYPPDKKMYAFGKGQVWSINLNRQDLKKTTLTKIGLIPEEKKGYPVFNYDSKNKVLGGGPTNNKFYVFDPRTKKWDSKDIKGGQPGSMRSWCLSYSSLENAYIFISAKNKVWAYRWKK
ncbi:MAG: hypothetical protein COA79_13450 [Planctomycetota bacterium]|nr:MAG: hypothetical protein COA79_13450 [Planctomycetota bacterium]